MAPFPQIPTLLVHRRAYHRFLLTIFPIAFSEAFAAFAVAEKRKLQAATRTSAEEPLEAVFAVLH